MKKLLLNLTAGALLIAPGFTLAFNGAVVDSFKIMQKIGPQIDAKLHGEFKEKQNQLDSQQAALQKRQEKLARDGAIMSRSERTKLQRDIQLKQREVQRLTREINEDIAFRRNEAIDQVTTRINQLIDKVEKEKGYEIILRKEAALFVEDKFDITDIILKRYEKTFDKKSS